MRRTSSQAFLRRTGGFARMANFVSGGRVSGT
jgi:hypothetical protein